jgi:lipopolysaccharide export system protein LptA
MARTGVLLGSVLLLAAASTAWAFTCPVVIKQAEDLIKKAEAGKVNADTRPLIEEAKKMVAEARAHHETAKTKRDHGDAVRKAKVAAAYAEEAITLQGP